MHEPTLLVCKFQCLCQVLHIVRQHQVHEQFPSNVIINNIVG